MWKKWREKKLSVETWRRDVHMQWPRSRFRHRPTKTKEKLQEFSEIHFSIFLQFLVCFSFAHILARSHTHTRHSWHGCLLSRHSNWRPLLHSTMPQCSFARVLFFSLFHCFPCCFVSFFFVYACHSHEQTQRKTRACSTVWFIASRMLQKLICVCVKNWKRKLCAKVTFSIFNCKRNTESTSTILSVRSLQSTNRQRCFFSDTRQKQKCFHIRSSSCLQLCVERKCTTKHQSSLLLAADETRGSDKSHVMLKRCSAKNNVGPNGEKKKITTTLAICIQRQKRRAVDRGSNCCRLRNGNRTTFKRTAKFNECVWLSSESIRQSTGVIH